MEKRRGETPSRSRVRLRARRRPRQSRGKIMSKKRLTILIVYIMIVLNMPLIYSRHAFAKRLYQEHVSKILFPLICMLLVSLIVTIVYLIWKRHNASRKVKTVLWGILVPLYISTIFFSFVCFSLLVFRWGLGL